MMGDTDGADLALARLRQLSPSEPGGWFWAGRRAARQGDRAAMCANWRQALRGSNRFLPQITRAVPQHLSAKELLEEVLPADASLIMRALADLDSQNAAPADETPFLKAALAALDGREKPLEAEDFLLKARIHKRLNDIPAACAAYTEALKKQSPIPWRLEYCRYLSDNGLYKQAAEQISAVLQKDRQNSEALALQQQVYLKNARGRDD